MTDHAQNSLDIKLKEKFLFCSKDRRGNQKTDKYFVFNDNRHKRGYRLLHPVTISNIQLLTILWLSIVRLLTDSRSAISVVVMDTFSLSSANIFTSIEMSFVTSFVTSWALEFDFSIL